MGEVQKRKTLELLVYRARMLKLLNVEHNSLSVTAESTCENASDHECGL